MTRDSYADSLIGMGNLATASGLPEHEQAFALLLTALALADKNTPGGCSRETFLEMAATTYDKLRRALQGGSKGGN